MSLMEIKMRRVWLEERALNPEKENYTVIKVIIDFIYRVRL